MGSHWGRTPEESVIESKDSSNVIQFLLSQLKDVGVAIKNHIGPEHHTLHHVVDGDP
jgi:hypothetical protein